jgi:hypothetical protein
MAIPELSVENLATANEAYADAGALVIRRLLATEAIERAQLLCAAGFSLFDIKVLELHAKQSRPDDPFTEYVRLYGLLQFISLDALKSILISASLGVQGFDAVSSAAREKLKLAFPDHPLKLIEGKSALRRQGAKRSSYVDWHRDAHAVQTVEHGDCFNCWIPIQAVGITRPSLQIVPGSHHQLTGRAVDYSRNEPVSDEEIVEQYGSEAIATAILEPGDVLLFGHHTLHRTQPMDRDHPERISAELRFTR